MDAKPWEEDEEGELILPQHLTIQAAVERAIESLHYDYKPAKVHYSARELFGPLVR